MTIIKNSLFILITFICLTSSYAKKPDCFVFKGGCIDKLHVNEFIVIHNNQICFYQAKQYYKELLCGN